MSPQDARHIREPPQNMLPPALGNVSVLIPLSFFVGALVLTFPSWYPHSCGVGSPQGWVLPRGRGSLPCESQAVQVLTCSPESGP